MPRPGYSTLMDEETRCNTVDYPFYIEEIAPILPPAVLDFHAHTWRSSDWNMIPWEAREGGARYMVVQEDYPVHKLLGDGRRAFPDREYRAVCFGYPTPAADNDKDTAYVASAGRCRGLYPLMVAGAELGVPQDVLRERLGKGNFLGFKVFLNWWGDEYGDKRVQDMLGPNEMSLADELGLVVLLHVPRSGRLSDPVIQQGVQWLSRGWPRARIVLAHCGRCYLPAEMARAAPSLRGLDNVYVDTSMVMDETVIRMVFDQIGPRRVLYATDFPVAAMRGRRVRVMDHWVDVVLDGYPPSAYRVGSSGIRATFMALEIALAIKSAARACGLSQEETRAVFYDNGMRLLEGVAGGTVKKRVEAGWDS
jgi:uncharacterized protein